MQRPTAGSTSPAKASRYRRDLAERRGTLIGEYRKLLGLLLDDLEREDAERFSVHIQLESELYQRLDACLKTSRALFSEVLPEDEIDRLVAEQKQLRTACARRHQNLQGRLKNSSLKQRPRRIYQQNQSMLDISC